MSGAPVSGKLRFLEQYLRSRAGDDGLPAAPLMPDEMRHVAGVIACMLPYVEAMEAEPAPLKFRVIVGGKQ